MDLRLLTAEDVRRALPMERAVAAMKEAYRQFSAGEADVPLRSRLEVASHQGVTLVMPSYLRRTGEMAVKIVSVFANNPSRQLPTIHSLVVAVDETTGAPSALLEGASLTAIRTGAASGAATEALARPNSRTLAVFGSGAQARTQLEAVCTVRPIQHVRIYSLDPPGAQRLAQSCAGKPPIPADVRVASSAFEALEEADVVCTATTSSTPVFEDSALAPGAHINAIGSFTPAMQEIDPQTIRRALLVVDSRQATLAETGDLILPIQDGLISPEDIYAELGEILSGSLPGRSDSAQITLFKSVGLAVQDAVAARVAVETAVALGLGTMVHL